MRFCVFVKFCRVVWCVFYPARLKFGDSYQVISQRSIASKEQLRSDHVDYPQWIKDRYLAIPDTTTQRVRDLAVDLTQFEDNPFDKAESIERHMRNQIAYNETIPAPPPNRDKVDYILFESQEAYCDYYATSMIVMLRSNLVTLRYIDVSISTFLSLCCV